MRIVYEDEKLLVADKPQGLPTATGRGLSLCETLFAIRPEMACVSGYREGEGGLLNRLDNDTGGLVMFAKTDGAFAEFSSLLREERIVKHYRADVLGLPEKQEGVICFSIGHHHKRSDRMVALLKTYTAAEPKPYRGRPQPCETRWRVAETFKGWSALEVTITRGVRHQIRVHLAALGHPILGDRVYGPQSWPEGVPVPEHHALWATGLEIPGIGMIFLKGD